MIIQKIEPPFYLFSYDSILELAIMYIKEYI